MAHTYTNEDEVGLEGDGAGGRNRVIETEDDSTTDDWRPTNV